MRILDATDTSTLSMTEYGDGSGIIVQSTDVSGAIRRNEELRRHGMTKTQDGDHFGASIPLDVLQEWGMKKYGVGWEVIGLDDKKLDEFLAEQTAWRVYEGRI
jgi:UDP-N-acetylenolpyruvoylglucosamine reductase